MRAVHKWRFIASMIADTIQREEESLAAEPAQES